MVHQPRWLSLFAIAVVGMFVLVACTPATGPTASPGASATTAPSATAAPSDEPSESPGESPSESPGESPSESPGESPSESPGESPSTEPPTGLQYPPEGGVVCRDGDTAGEFNGEEYTGNIESIQAPDDMTVVFNLCSPDVAFLQKVAFTVFAINDSDWLEANVPSGAMLTTMNGTGALQFDEWRAGSEILYSRYDGYHGEPSAVASAVLRWSAESAARLTELQSGNVHGITNVGPDDFETVANDPALQLATPEGGANLNTLYLGMNHNVEPWSDPLVRQAIALGIDKQRLVDNFYPEGSEVATHFTPCAIEFGCEGEAFPEMDTAAAIDLLDQAGYNEANPLTTTIQYRNVIRGYQPLAPQIAQDLQLQLADLGITAEIEEQESATFIENSNQGLLDGLFMLGWGADYPEVTNFLDFHFGPGATSAFGDFYPSIADPLSVGNSTADPAARAAAYAEANTAIVEEVPMVPVAHGAFGNAYVAGVDVAQASPISNEMLARMAPPEGEEIVFMQNAEPGTLYCADETDGEALRACEQSMEGLYGYATNTSEVEPVLATACEPNEDASQWTCTLKEGVTFHDGATFEAQDVITSFALQWDAAHPLHVGSTSQFEYFPGLWGGFLNASAQPAPPEE